MSVAIEDPRVWQRIVPYLDQALDLAPAQIGVWLNEVERTQPEIATLVRELLAERDLLNAIGFLATPLAETDLAWLTLCKLLRARNSSH